MNHLRSATGIVYTTPLLIIGGLLFVVVGLSMLQSKNDQTGGVVKAATKRARVINTGIPVNTDRGLFYVDMVKANVAEGIKVITDSANTTDCLAGCDALPLSDYIGRNGGYAGINGTYFCPPDYTDCAGKPYSFHWFVFNYGAKTFLNADKRYWDNAGSLFVFRPGSIQFIRNPDTFGLDTSITGAIASFPTLLVDRQIVLDESKIDDKQYHAKGNRGGLCNSGNTVMLMVAKRANVPDLAAIMLSLGCDNGVNLDGGGSSALFDGGYKVGPGRKLPNAIILAR